MITLGLDGAANEAAKVFRTFTDGKPEYVSIGIGPVDRVIGGLDIGATGVLGAGTGVGKSSIIFSSAVANPGKVGILSLEDPPPVWGARALGWASGVDSRRIRIKEFMPHEIPMLKEGQEKLKAIKHIKLVFAVAAGLDEVLEAVEELALDGCKLIWIDYLQKIRGLSEDRRNEVSTVYVRIQRRCSELGMACMFVSQFRRVLDPYATPSINWLKESGDIENEARLILLFQKDPKITTDVIGRVAKSTNGGEGLPIRYRRDDSGTLQPIDFFERKVNEQAGYRDQAKITEEGY